MSLYEELEDYVKNQFISPDKHVYHYTTESGYCDITRSMYLKLNSHLFLNDKNKINQELEPGINLIKNILKENNHYSILRTFEAYMAKGIVYYTASFTQRRSINQFGCFCMELCPSFLKRSALIYRTSLFSSIIYNPLKQIEIVEKIFKIYKQQESHKKNQEALFTWLSVILPLFKNEEHRNDEECRIVQAEIFAPDTKELSTPRVSKKISFTDNEIIQIYRE